MFVHNMCIQAYRDILIKRAKDGLMSQVYDPCSWKFEAKKLKF